MAWPLNKLAALKTKDMPAALKYSVDKGLNLAGSLGEVASCHAYCR